MTTLGLLEKRPLENRPPEKTPLTTEARRHGETQTQNLTTEARRHGEDPDRVATANSNQSENNDQPADGIQQSAVAIQSANSSQDSAGAIRSELNQSELNQSEQSQSGQDQDLSTDGQAQPSKAGRVGHFLRRTTGRLVILALIAMTVRIFVGEASVVPTGSMEGTILVGDHLFMDKLLYGPEIPIVHWRLPRVKSIHRGDIIVFRYPKNPADTYLKRVAAVGGDTLEIRDGVVYVNSRPVNEPYVVHNFPAYASHEQMAARVIPQNALFVMGDNRDNSSDSRDWGLVPEKNVLGEPMIVYWSYDAPTARWLDETPSHQVAFYASIMENFFSRTRWSRMGMRF